MSDNSPTLDVLTANGIGTEKIRRPEYDTGERPASLLRVGVIGYGYWGPNIVRNFHGLDAFDVAAVCDKNPAALRRAHRAYPGVRLSTDFIDVILSPASPTSSMRAGSLMKRLSALPG